MKQPLSPLCFVMPTQYQQFIDVSDALGFSTQWILKPIVIGGRSPGPQLVNVFTNEGRLRLKDFNTKRGVIQQFVTNPLLIFGQAANLRIYSVVTSVGPLRAFVHNEGLVFHRHDEGKNFRKVS